MGGHGRALWAGARGATARLPLQVQETVQSRRVVLLAERPGRLRELQAHGHTLGVRREEGALARMRARTRAREIGQEARPLPELHARRVPAWQRDPEGVHTTRKVEHVIGMPVSAEALVPPV